MGLTSSDKYFSDYDGLSSYLKGIDCNVFKRWNSYSKQGRKQFDGFMLEKNIGQSRFLDDSYVKYMLMQDTVG